MGELPGTCASPHAHLCPRGLPTASAPRAAAGALKAKCILPPGPGSREQGAREGLSDTPRSCTVGSPPPPGDFSGFYISVLTTTDVCPMA